MTDHHQLDDLDAAASSYVIPSGDVDAVMTRGRRIRARRRNGVALLTVLALVGAGIGARDALGGGTDEIPVAADGSIVRGDTGMTWRITTPKEGLGGLGMATSPAGEGPIYALSTAAGERYTEKLRANGVVWRSVDGVDWVAASKVDDDLHLSDLATADGRIYAVGTAAATAAVGTKGAYDLVAGWSDDDGTSFERTRLPLDLRAIAKPGAAVGVTSASVAAGAKGTMIVITLASAPDVRRFLPAGVAAPNGWAFTDTGVDVLDDQRNGCDTADDRTTFEKLAQLEERTDMTGFRCAADGASGATPQEIFGVVSSYSYAELGIAGDLLRAVRRQPVAFHAAPGSTEFERVDVPETIPTYGPTFVEAHDGGFDVITSGADLGTNVQRVVALRSEDGRAFGPSAAVPSLMWVTAVGRVQGVTTIVGATPRGSVVVRSNGDGTWSTTPLSSVVDPEALQGRTAQAYVAGVGPFGIAVSVVLSDERGGDPGRGNRILVSRNGTEWSDTPLADLVGDRKVRGVPRIVVTSDRVVLTVATGECQPNCEGPSEQIAVIGVTS